VNSKFIGASDRIIRVMRLFAFSRCSLLLSRVRVRALPTRRCSSARQSIERRQRSRQTTKGFAIGAGVVIVGVEFEYASAGRRRSISARR
jgi:hypothetical protein